MSRIGKKTITIPSGVEVNVGNNIIKVTGRYGVLEKKIFKQLQIKQDIGQLWVTCLADERKARALHGLMRALIQNMIIGVCQKFSKTLIAEGIGYKFLLDDKVLTLNMGFTNLVFLQIPNNLTVNLELPTRLTVSGIDKEDVGLFSAEIRNVRPPEPYKGKGIRYSNEIIRRKVGKTRK